MNYRNAKIEDLAEVKRLQETYHVDSISDEDRPNGFVTTLFTEKQFRKLIESENGLALACDGNRIVGYAMAASWEYWSAWPLFQHMIQDLENTEYLGENLTTENSYQYGPIAVHSDYRGTDVFPNLFEFSRIQMKQRYPIMITFVNQINPRSVRAHEKIGLDLIKEFKFNNNSYYELGYDTSLKTRGSNLISKAN